MTRNGIGLLHFPLGKVILLILQLSGLWYLAFNYLIINRFLPTITSICDSMWHTLCCEKNIGHSINYTGVLNFFITPIRFRPIKGIMFISAKTETNKWMKKIPFPADGRKRQRTLFFNTKAWPNLYPTAKDGLVTSATTTWKNIQNEQKFITKWM